MPEVLSVETEDDLNERAYRPPAPLRGGSGPDGFGTGEGGIPPWVIFAILGGLVVLAAFIGLLLFRGGGSEKKTDGKAKTSSTLRTNTNSELPANDERVVAAQDALDAWGQFGATFDVDVLRGTFDPEGPQYKFLEGEAAADPDFGGDPYDYKLTHPREVKSDQDGPTIRSIVEVSRNGSEPVLYYWDITLSARTDGRQGWWLYTVNETPEEFRKIETAAGFCDLATQASELLTGDELTDRVKNADDDQNKLALELEERAARAEIWNGLAKAAPASIADDAQKVADAEQFIYDEISGAENYDDLTTSLNEAVKASVVKDAADAFEPVNDLAKSECGVEVNG